MSALPPASSLGRSEPGDPRLLGLAPVVGRETRLLVLGSFPGEASLAAQQYYGHPRNHFWPLLGAVWAVDLVGMAYPQRLAALRARGVGLWDVYASCRRIGSLDQHITEPVLNDLAQLRRLAPGLRLATHNGGESARAMKLTAELLGTPTVRLPSSSPANASWSFDRKLAAWRAAFVAAGVVEPT